MGLNESTDWVPGGSPGTHLAKTTAGSLRTARNGVPGLHGVYHRYQSVDKVRPPFIWSGQILCRSIMNPAIFGPNTGHEGETAWYTPTIVFHPLYPSNEHNVLINFGSASNPIKTGASAEMRLERPERPYGVRTGYVSRYFENLPAYNPYDGQIHSFEIVVPSNNEYILRWDGVTVVHIVEALPATVPDGFHSIAVRLDHTDVEFFNMKLESIPRPNTSGKPMIYITPKRLDTRAVGGKIEGIRTFSLRSFPGVPATAQTIQFTLTAVGNEQPGFATAWDGSGPVPDLSCLNYTAINGAICNTTVTRCLNGKFSIFSSAKSHYVIDVLGYQLP